MSVVTTDTAGGAGQGGAGLGRAGQGTAIEALPIVKLIEDMSLYPRHAVDEGHIARLAIALRAGAHFPPVVADSKSFRIVDGWHRIRAYKRVVGPEAVIDVDLRCYANEADLLLDAISRNARHGRKLDRQDEIRAIVLAEEKGVEEKRIAVALQVPPERIRTLRIRVAYAPTEGPSTITGTRKIALKRPVQHMADHKLTKAQAEAHRTIPGVSFLLIATQLTLALKTDLVNRSDERLTIKLQELREALSKWLKTP